MRSGFPQIVFGIVLVLASAGITAAFILVLRPLLQRYTLARPNERSSHSTPTPQGGGLAVIAVTMVSASSAVLWTGSQSAAFAALLLAATLLAIIGAVDDVFNVGIAPRLLVQVCAVTIAMAALPADLQLAAALPLPVERLLLGLIALWFINLVNFMDGIDWMTVAEVVPITAALALLGFLDIIPFQATIVAFALCGAMLGFAPFNKPVARLFLGDVGSLPIGLLLSWLLILLAASGHIVAALLLPLYYLADATITLGRRIARGAPFWKAHREHYYQRAFDGGLSATAVVTRVFIINLFLALLTIGVVTVPGAASSLFAVASGVAAVAWLLRSFSSAH